MKALLAQIRTELLLTLRRGESLLVTFMIPLGLMWFFTKVDVIRLTGNRADALAPGIAALAIMASAMVSMGIATGFERHYLVLKRLGATPLGRGRLLTAKIVTIAVIELMQVGAVVAMSKALGGDPQLDLIALAAAALLGTAAFGGIGLLLAGTLRGEMNLALNNALFVLMVLVGGAIVDVGSLPGPLAAAAKMMPLHPLTQAFSSALGHPSSTGWPVLVAWAVCAPVLAAALFRWEPRR